MITVHGSEVQGSGLTIFHIFAFNLSENCWLSNFFGNGYYSYHYNYLTTQLFDDLTRSEFRVFVINFFDSLTKSQKDDFFLRECFIFSH